MSKQEKAARQRAKVEELRRREAALQTRRLVFIIAGAVLALAAMAVIAFTGFGTHDSGKPTPSPSPSPSASAAQSFTPPAAAIAAVWR